VGSTVWATRDGGATWQTQTSGEVNFSSLDALDANHVWALGVQYPSFVATTDGGETWIRLPEPGTTLDSVHFISPMVGFAVAGGTATGVGIPECGGVLLKTRNGGRTWRQLPSPPNVQSACFSTAANGWLSASNANHADIYHSSNGGVSWHPAFTPPLTPSALNEGFTGAALAQVQCAHGAVWALYLGLGSGVSNQAPWFAYHGSVSNHWTPVFEETYAEASNLTIPVRAQAPAGYPGPFSAISASSAMFLGDDVIAVPPTAVADLATEDGAKLESLGPTTGIETPSGAAFLSSQVGWVVGEGTTDSCSDQAGPLCPWLIDATTDGGRSWVTQMRYAP